MATRILFVHDAAIIGGAELHLLSVARHFRESATVVLFADGPFRQALEAAGVRVRVFGSRWVVRGVRREGPRFSFANIASVIRLVWLTAHAARGSDLIYANSPKAVLVVSIARLVRRKPVIWFLHDLLIETHFSPQSIRLLVAAANRTAARIVANSKATAAAFVAAGGRGDRTRVVYYGVDAAPFTDTGVELSALRADLRPDGSYIAGIFGRMTRWKGQDVVLRALVNVPSVVAVFVGAEEDPAFAEELRRLAHELRISDRVRFLGFREDVPQLMRAVDCVVHVPTDPEPFGRVVVEGVLARRPVIATRYGGIPEIIENGVSGILIAPGSPDELANALRRVFSDRGAAAEMAATGRARALAFFNDKRMLSEIEQHLREIASAS
ncbi:MAG: glycosyltransferase [Chthoniobacterales bacterium]